MPSKLSPQCPSATSQGVPGRHARAVVVDKVERMLEKDIEPKAHLMSGQWKVFVAVGQAFAGHDTVQHGRRDIFVARFTPTRSREFNLRVQRTVAGVFRHMHLCKRSSQSDGIGRAAAWKKRKSSPLVSTPESR